MAYKLRSPLKPYGRKDTSQNDEDGIIEAVFSDVAPNSRYFVEFGVGPNWLDPTYSAGLEGNCVALQKEGWSGLFMDGGRHPDQYGIKQEFITPLNVNGLFRKHGVPSNVDIVSIDVDGQDFWLWMACTYRPILFIIEMNPNFLKLDQALTVPFDPNFRWDGTKFYGASLGALVKLGYEKGYKLVYANGVNAFFLRSDLLANPEDFPDSALNIFVDQHAYDHFRRPWVTI